MTVSETRAGMLKENTGTHFLDSGGDKNRNWQRNAARDFSAEPVAKMEASQFEEDKVEILVSKSVYHFLLNRLEPAEAMNTRFDKYANEREDEHWLEIMEGFAASCLSGAKLPNIVNTYNGEDLLSQVLQYAAFEIEGNTYALIQIHGGADVRGGYTAPKAFQLDEIYSLMRNADATVY